MDKYKETLELICRVYNTPSIIQGKEHLMYTLADKVLKENSNG